MSRTTLSGAEERFVIWTPPAGTPATWRSVPNARVRPAPNGSTETERSTPPGPTCSDPAAPGLTAVTFALTETASGGTPHFPLTVKTRVPLAGSAGPPEGPAGLRVSRTRQGGSAVYVVLLRTGVQAMRCDASSVRYTRP